MMVRENFWQRPLDSLNDAEWEALCDGCGRCCLHKLQDEEDDQVYFTDVVCRLFDQRQGGCQKYEQRQQLVADCLSIRDAGEAVFAFLPSTCAYRLRFQGQPLPAWHPLLSGDPGLLQQLGIGIRNRVVCETQIQSTDDLEERIIHWVEA